MQSKPEDTDDIVCRWVHSRLIEIRRNPGDGLLLVRDNSNPTRYRLVQAAKWDVDNEPEPVH